MSAHLEIDWHLPVSSLPALLAGIFLATLTIFLLRVGRGRRAALSLALLLGVGAGSSILAFVFDGFTRTYPMAVMIALTQVFWTMQPWLWACFAMMLLAERTRVPRLLQVFPTYLVPALSLAMVGIWKPELFWDYSAFVSATLVEDAPSGSFPFQHPQVLLLVNRVVSLASPSLALLLAWWALRREESEQWSSILVIALASAGTGAFALGTNIDLAIQAPGDPVRAGERLVTIVAGLLIVAFAGLLFHDGLRGRTKRRQLARGGATFILAMGLVGVWIGLTPSTPLLFSAFLALAMLTFPTLATYALLRHRLLGLDVKVRWGVSRGTIAAAFIATFFVASEGAQILFGQGNEWVGLLAAGALVFAIAPLQRVADRLAEKAVPPSSDAGSGLANRDGEGTYRRAVIWATRDAALTPDEERDLLVIATRLGITPERAFDIRNEVEQERRQPERGGPMS